MHQSIGLIIKHHCDIIRLQDHLTLWCSQMDVNGCKHTGKLFSKTFENTFSDEFLLVHKNQSFSGLSKCEKHQNYFNLFNEPALLAKNSMCTAFINMVMLHATWNFGIDFSRIQWCILQFSDIDTNCKKKHCLLCTEYLQNIYFHNLRYVQK